MTRPAKPETLGAKLLRYRQSAGLTIPQLAEKSDVAMGTISNAENDKNRRNKNVPAFLEVDFCTFKYIYF